MSQLEPGLYIVSTPIGNLEDITLRAIRILREASVILAEDTRVTGRLLKHLDISNRMLSSHAHNETGRIPQVIRFLEEGQAVAMVSDAGTPLISDPGHRIVKAAIEAGFPIIPIPGASAVLAALVASGLPLNQFLFEGFLPRKKGRQTTFQNLAEFPGTIVVYESAVRLQKTLQDIEKYWGSRYIVVSREITKRYEEFKRASVSELLQVLPEMSLKGEIVLVISGSAYKNDDH